MVYRSWRLPPLAAVFTVLGGRRRLADRQKEAAALKIKAAVI